MGNNIEVSVEKPVGKIRLIPSTRKLQLIFHDRETVKQVRVNRKKVEHWEYDPRTRQLIVDKDCRSNQGMTLEVIYA